MINDIKAGLKLLKYGLQAKTMVVMLVVFFVLGTFMESFANETLGNMGGFYLIIVGTYLFQLVMTTTIANVIQSSPLKKKLQTLLPSLFCFVTVLVMYLFFAALRFARTASTLDISDKEQVATIFTGLIVTGLMAFIMQVYNGVTYKYFIPAMLIMIVFLIPVMMFGMNGTRPIRLGNMTYPITYLLVGLILIVAGGVIGYIISCILYRKEMDPKTYKAAMSRAGR